MDTATPSRPVTLTDDEIREIHNLATAARNDIVSRAAKALHASRGAFPDDWTAALTPSRNEHLTEIQECRRQWHLVDAIVAKTQLHFDGSIGRDPSDVVYSFDDDVEHSAAGTIARLARERGEELSPEQEAAYAAWSYREALDQP